MRIDRDSVWWIGALICLFPALVFSIVNLHQEAQVVYFRHQLESARADHAGRPSASDEERPASQLPARAALLRGSKRTIDAANQPPGPERDLNLAGAREDIDRAAAARRWWADADVAAAYRAFIVTGTVSPETRTALILSYDAAPFLRTAAAWRIRLGVAGWASLPPATRTAVVEETAWLARSSGTSYRYATGLVAGTPAEERVRALLARPAT